MALDNERSLKMDSSNRLSSILNPEAVEVWIKADTMTRDDWARIILYLVRISRERLKYFPRMKPVAERINVPDWIGDQKDLFANRETSPSVIQPREFDTRLRCLVLTHNAENLPDGRPGVRRPGALRHHDPLWREKTLLLADNGEVWFWDAVYARHETYRLTGKYREIVRLKALSSSFTLLQTREELAAVIDPETIKYSLLHRFAYNLEQGIRQRTEQLQGMQAVCREASRIREHISFV